MEIGGAFAGCLNIDRSELLKRVTDMALQPMRRRVGLRRVEIGDEHGQNIR